MLDKRKLQYQREIMTKTTMILLNLFLKMSSLNNKKKEIYRISCRNRRRGLKTFRRHLTKRKPFQMTKSTKLKYKIEAVIIMLMTKKTMRSYMTAKFQEGKESKVMRTNNSLEVKTHPPIAFKISFQTTLEDHFHLSCISKK